MQREVEPVAELRQGIAHLKIVVIGVWHRSGKRAERRQPARETGRVPARGASPDVLQMPGVAEQPAAP